MNYLLGLRTLALLAFVAASTAVIVRPDLLKAGAAAPIEPGASTLLVVGAAWTPSRGHPEFNHG
jgi:hypothetical protein